MHRPTMETPVLIIYHKLKWETLLILNIKLSFFFLQNNRANIRKDCYFIPSSPNPLRLLSEGIRYFRFYLGG